jgi:hypothetical protein
MLSYMNLCKNYKLSYMNPPKNYKLSYINHSKNYKLVAQLVGFRGFI